MVKKTISMFRRVSMEQAVAYSPWPGRILKPLYFKPSAPEQRIRQEYDEKYEKLSESWALHRQSSTITPPVQLALSFLFKIDDLDWQQIANHPEIYGSIRSDETLISFQEELYVGDGLVAGAFFRQFVVRSIVSALRLESFETIVEIGCGSGYNLINIACQTGIECVGCDVSGVAINAINRIATDTGIQISGYMSSYFDGSFTEFAADKRWALLSVHALEQSPDITIDWLERLLRTKSPPSIGIHVEPLHSADGQFSDWCLTYAKLNRYNTTFLDVLIESERRGAIDILEYCPRVIGTNAFNPSSLVLWRIKRR